MVVVRVTHKGRESVLWFYNSLHLPLQQSRGTYSFSHTYLSHRKLRLSIKCTVVLFEELLKIFQQIW